ncbi:MAG TPA: class II aldolase/adducin family protein [Nitrosomonas sp.]|nr:class II aldolase/adducin family protein [Nitrosomonas sp.]HQX14317.1 class II aldolase/adducin family protein [Nitrosomonas sp.]HRB33609.1 class II aldolase/adducin family protein [Nitrosomonas sp.]HRB46361.1 class II aldolase/adducin family protein [Nitrosomonas sp.]HRB78230.1 class II aldolase/adducin family protein [Nitrosomonas sp.]
MTSHNDHIRTQMIEFCATIGKNPLLVQGAGGNVSWKNKDTLWIKASGTWLAEADQRDIFVPVNLQALQQAIQQNDFSVTPQLMGAYELKPSIETLLHALMPQPIVVHLHAIEILAQLVRANCEDTLKTALDRSIPWVLVDYHKPGQELANAIHEELIRKPNAQVVFMRNHGVVIGASSIQEITATLTLLTSALQVPVSQSINVQHAMISKRIEYTPIQDDSLHELAINPHLFDRLAHDWALYPDHVVFLCPQAHTYSNWQQFDADVTANSHDKPELIFIRDQGVFVMPSFQVAKQVQLRCYLDVLKRQRIDTTLISLTHSQIAELLNWDAEKYRMHLLREATQ